MEGVKMLFFCLAKKSINTYGLVIFAPSVLYKGFREVRRPNSYGEEPSTKDEQHLRISSTTTHVEVKVEDAINVTLGQAEFLTNSKNKMQLIAVITVHLQQAGFKVTQGEVDADTKIVFTAIKLADLRDTVINQILLHTRERRLLIHARDSTLRIIDLKTGCVLHWLQGSINNRFNTKCSFSACGNYVFAGGENGLINVWNADTGESIATYAPYDTFHYQNLTIHCIHFHPHDNILAISHYGHGLPILLVIYDNTVHGKNNIGLQLLQHDDEIQMHRKDPLSTTVNMKSIANKIVTNSDEKKQGKIKFEDVIEKIDQIIFKQSAIGNSSRNSLDNLVS